MRAPIRGGVHSWYPSLLDSRQILLPLTVTLSVDMEDGEEVKGIEDPRVVDMYKVAGDIANRTYYILRNGGRGLMECLLLLTEMESRRSGQGICRSCCWCQDQRSLCDGR